MYRKNFTELTSSELDRLATALKALWTDGTITANATLHDDNFHSGIHGGPAFLPWHRDFLLKFEQALQVIDSTVTLPYWDWTRSDSRDLDSGPWKTFFGGRNNTGGRFDDWSYTRAAAPPGGITLPTLADIIAELQATTFTGYRAVESGSHNPGHLWTGGTMRTGNSPLDPLFYLHHCNLDRLWAVWQQNNPTAEQYNHMGGAGATAARVPLDSQMIGGSTPASMLDHLALGYRYERDVLLEIAWFEAGHGNLQTGDRRSTDVYIRDAADDTGDTPSSDHHWTSPDIWVRNEDPTAPDENPDDGHQVPIVNATNYLYVRVLNRGDANSGPQEVEAFHCNPGTAMLWPDHFTSMGKQIVADIPSRGEVRAGPFPWTPAVAAHECLLAIASGVNDPSVAPQLIGSVPHWKLVRFDNNVGQRNVAPIHMPLGAEFRVSLKAHGAARQSTNELRLNAAAFPADTAIQVRVPNSVGDSAQLKELTPVGRNSRFTTLSLKGGATGVIDAFRLRARQDINVALTFNFSVHATHLERYPLIATQRQDDQLAGQLTLEVIAVKDPEDFVYGNTRSKELHTVNCPFWPRFLNRNKRAFVNIKEGLALGYNGCAFCLADHHTD